MIAFPVLSGCRERSPLRAGTGDEKLEAAIDEAIAHKPRSHDFVLDDVWMPVHLKRPPLFHSQKLRFVKTLVRFAV